jgi:hypothetical protein
MVIDSLKIPEDQYQKIGIEESYDEAVSGRLLNGQICFPAITRRRETLTLGRELMRIISKWEATVIGSDGDNISVCDAPNSQIYFRIQVENGW